jgi:hypothetical protein
LGKRKTNYTNIRCSQNEEKQQFQQFFPLFFTQSSEKRKKEEKKTLQKKQEHNKQALASNIIIHLNPLLITTTNITHRQDTEAKITETETATAGSSTTSTTTFTTLPKDVHYQLPQFLTSYETITGLSASASWLRRLCLPLVDEVHLVVPSLVQAFITAQVEGNDAAGYTCLPRNDEEWTTWIEEQSAKLSTGLLAHLPNLRHLYGYLSNPHFHFILGKALCQIKGLPWKIEELFWKAPEKEDFLLGAWTPTFTQEEVSPIAEAIAKGKLPALEAMDSFDLNFNQGSLTEVARSISCGLLPNLAHLVITMTEGMEQLVVMGAFTDPYIIPANLENNPRQQVQLQTLDIRGVDEASVQLPLMMLLQCNYTQNLSQLHLGKWNVSQENLLTAALYYLSNDGAPTNKRLHLKELSFPAFIDDDYDFMDGLVRALTVHQIAPNLESLSCYQLGPLVVREIASIYQGGGLQHLRKLDLGFLLDISPLTEFFQGVAQCANKGGVLEELMGEAVLEGGGVGVLARELCEGLKAGAFPRLQLLVLRRSSRT